MSPDGTRWASARYYCHLVLSDVVARADMVLASEEKTFDRDPSPPDDFPTNIHSPVFSTNGSKLACAIGKAKVRVWDVDTRSLLSELCVSDCPISSLALSPDGSCIASLGHTQVQIWDVTGGMLIASRESLI